jgi:hypothetical protein
MIIGRQKELSLLEQLYTSDKFEFFCLYGRRRVGKSTLLTEFASKHNCIFITGQEKNNPLNQSDLVKAVCNYFNVNFTPEFKDWKPIFEFIDELINKSSKTEKTVIIVDEFPYIAKEDASIKSALQTVIDRSWKLNSNILLILCGSSVSFMVNDVMGSASPLHGRATCEYELLPFDYTITKEFYPNMSNVERVISYGILGGIPLYLLAFSDKKSLKQNIIDGLLSPMTIMRREPLNLLRMELREPLFYNSILLSISQGATKIGEVAGKVYDDNAKVSKYLDTLKEIRIVERALPYGENSTSKKGIYQIKDNYFKFWYRFIFPNDGKIELLGDDKTADNILETLPDYMGLVFESICTEYMINQAKAGKLPFTPNGFGKWWGNNPQKKCRDDIDIIGIDGNRGIFCECKFQNELFDLAEFKDLISASDLFKNVTEKYYYIFVKSGYTQAVIDEAENYNVKLLTIDDLFE